MANMSRPRPPYLLKEVTRHGRIVWYVRKGTGPRIRVRGDYGTDEFNIAYKAALVSERPANKPGKASAGTLAWLIERYRETTAWEDLSATTRRNRENHFRQVLEAASHEPFRSVTQAVIVKARDRRGETPAQARNFLDAMRGLFRWAKDAQHVSVDPTAGVKNPKRRKGPGFRIWTEEEMARYEAKWPLGTRQRVWLDVLAYTGLRRGDAVRLGRQHTRNGIAKLKTEKTGAEVTLPILPILQVTLDTGPCGDLTFIVGANGRPLTKESFGNLFREACNAAGVPGSAHGIRKIAATRAAENGATVAELEAIFGWHGGGMASHYTKEANRVRLAREAMHKLATSNPAPNRQQPRTKEKS